MQAKACIDMLLQCVGDNFGDLLEPEENLMTGATSGQSARKTEIALVLQGGGALGAYEWGGILALFDLMDQAKDAGRDVTLRVVTGVSIGAINAACIVGATDRNDARKRLDEVWNSFMIRMPFLSGDVAFYMVPHFYTLRSDLLTLPTWKYLYDTHSLLQTLSDHVDFNALNRSETAFVITAVDVESGQLAWFANQKVGVVASRKIEPKHVLASGSLAPQFPWTDMADSGEERHYWDGGLIDNTPLGAAIDAFDPDPSINKLLVVMNLFPLQANLPQTYTEVSERVDQLCFGNRLRQDTSTAKQFNTLISTIQRLAALVPEMPPDLRETVSKFKLVEPVEISLGPQDSLADPYGFRDFSQQGIEQRRDRGKAIALDTLKQFSAGQLTA
jgi:NTE family protein